MIGFVLAMLSEQQSRSIVVHKQFAAVSSSKA
jgi:hypothetical protein